MLRFQSQGHHLGAALLAVACNAAMASPPTNLVTNGDFEATGVGQIGSVVAGTGWTNPTVWSSEAQRNVTAFNFILDESGDDQIHGLVGGFASENTPSLNTNIFVWGPDNGVPNGFRTSSNGGKFLGGDGGYATGALTQTISGLTVGQQYTLSFEWGGAQFTDIPSSAGPYWVGWDVSFGAAGTTGETFSVGGSGTTIPANGFLDWAVATTTFTASAATQVLSFLATGPSGLPPLSLLDGVVLTPVTPPVPEPSSLALLLAGAGVVSLVVRRRRHQR